MQSQRPSGTRGIAAPGTIAGDRQRAVLIVATDPDERARLTELIEAEGWLALPTNSLDTGLRSVAEALPDLLILALDDTTGRELALLDAVRARSDGERVPVVCLIPNRKPTLAADAFGRRADDVISARTHPMELMARLRLRMDRRPTPTAALTEDPITGALTPAAFDVQLANELERVDRGGRPGSFAYLSIHELPGIEARYGQRGRDQIKSQIVRLVEEDSRSLDFVGFSEGVLGLLMPGTPRRGAQIRMERLTKKIYEKEFDLAGERVRLTPISGYTETVPAVSADTIRTRAWTALSHQADHLDLHPTRWVQAMTPESAPEHSRLRRAFERVRTPLQVIAQQLAVLGIPLGIYILLGSLGIDITGVMYILIVLALALTAAAIIVESRAARPRHDPPPEPEGELPLGSAIIAAYLPNEAETIIETIEAFLDQDYPHLQIILAYNTPEPMDVEDRLRAIAARDSRFESLRVEGSVSKAQNVNAALAHVRGEFVGLFDADHHPAPGSFLRAWQWLASGAGVVQGHCVIRNGDQNRVTRLVAAEFEAIYAVAHPGRARVYDFGIFGGSNGYWRTSLLHRTRMRGFMLTEDIDSSMRVLHDGEVIISDPHLVSTELAPDTFKALWNQRLRWAQGWSQVSLRHLTRMVRAETTWRRRLGVAYLLGWREIYPWISLQMLPLMAYWLLFAKGAVDWFIPVFVATSVFTTTAGPIQAWYAYKLGHPSITRNRRWFAGFLISSLVYYTEWKNVIARTAHIKEAMRERVWKVTPRSSSAPDTSSEAGDAPAAVEEPIKSGALLGSAPLAAPGARDRSPTLQEFMQSAPADPSALDAADAGAEAELER